LKLFVVEIGLLGGKNLFTFDVIGIGNAAVHGAHGSTLGFFVKPGTFCAFPGHYIIEFVRNGLLRRFGVNFFSLQFNRRQFGAASPVPFPATFINGRVRTLGFASPAIDTLFSYFDRHSGRFL
jgi:hypothetical protein